MMTAYFIFLILSPWLFLGKEKADVITDNELVKSLINGFYYIIPKTWELMGDITVSIASGREISDYQPVLSSFLFLVIILLSGLYLFKKKDF
jgi:hypothetical protein